MQNKDYPQLLNCPFCGGTNIYVDGYDHAAGKRWRVVCLNCMATVDPGTEQQKYRAIEAWNRRADDNGWIAVSDGLPKKDGDVWAWVAFGNTEGGNMILYFAKNGDDVDEYGLFGIRGKTNVFCNLDDGEWFIIDSVTHWCPLPEPPKGAKR